MGGHAFQLPRQGQLDWLHGDFGASGGQRLENWQRTEPTGPARGTGQAQWWREVWAAEEPLFCLCDSHRQPLRLKGSCPKAEGKPERHRE